MIKSKHLSILNWDCNQNNASNKKWEYDLHLLLKTSLTIDQIINMCFVLQSKVNTWSNQICQHKI